MSGGTARLISRSSSAAVIVVIAVVLAVLAALLLWRGGSDDGERQGGPLQGAEVSSLGIPAVAGRTLTFSLPVVYNVDEDAEVVLDRVEFDKPDAGLDLVGALATGNSRQANYKDSDDRFPPASSVYGKPRPLRGTKVPPSSTRAGEAGVELLVGVRARRSGRIGARGLVVHYTAGEERYRVRVPNAFVLCANPPGRPFPRNFICDERGLPPQGDTRVGRS